MLGAIADNLSDVGSQLGDVAGAVGDVVEDAVSAVGDLVPWYLKLWLGCKAFCFFCSCKCKTPKCCKGSSKGDKKKLKECEERLDDIKKKDLQELKEALDELRDAVQSLKSGRS